MPYGFHIEVDSYEVCMDWCETEFGEVLDCGDNGRWTYRKRFFPSYHGISESATIYFQNEEDAIAFKLRWA